MIGVGVTGVGVTGVGDTVGVSVTQPGKLRFASESAGCVSADVLPFASVAVAVRFVADGLHVNVKLNIPAASAVTVPA